MTTLLTNPIFAALGLLVLLGVLLAPLALKLAGLSGAQIIEVLKATMQFIVDIIREFRADNRK